MEWLNRSIGEHIKGGSLPSVPEELRLEECMYTPTPHPRRVALAKKFLDVSPWATRDKKRIPFINDISSLASYYWPNSTEDSRALTLIKYMQWIFLVDNVVDDLDCLQADKLCHRLQHHLFNSEVPLPPALSDSRFVTELEPLITSLGFEWWTEIQATSSLTQQARFATVFTKYLRYQAALARMRERFQRQRILPRLEEYTVLRMFSSGFMTCLALVEYDAGVELDQEIYESPLLQQLLVAAHNHTAHINDIFSFPTEFANGDAFNLLSVLHHRNNERNGEVGGEEAPFPVAVSQAWRMVKEEDQQVARLAQQLRQSLNAKMMPHLEKYVDAICTLPPGNWEWMLSSPRYQVKPLIPSTPPTRASISCTFSECRSSPFPALAFSPFKSLLRNTFVLPKFGRILPSPFKPRLQFHLLQQSHC